MEKTKAKVLIFALLPVFLLQLSNLVGAVDVVLFTTPGCDQEGVACMNSPMAVICCPNAGTLPYSSVLVTNAPSNAFSQFYTTGGSPCSDYAGHSDVGNNVCSYAPASGPQYNGALWGPSSRRRSLLDQLDSATIGTPVMEPNAVVFTEDGTSLWMLHTSNVAELHSQMINVAHGEKVAWLKSRGATYSEL